MLHIVILFMINCLTRQKKSCWGFKPSALKLQQLWGCCSIWYHTVAMWGYDRPFFPLPQLRHLGRFRFSRPPPSLVTSFSIPTSSVAERARWACCRGDLATPAAISNMSARFPWSRRLDSSSMWRIQGFIGRGESNDIDTEKLQSFPGPFCLLVPIDTYHNIDWV